MEVSIRAVVGISAESPDSHVYEQTLQSLQACEGDIRSSQENTKDPLPSAAKKWLRLSFLGLSSYCLHRLGKPEALGFAQSFVANMRKSKFHYIIDLYGLVGLVFTVLAESEARVHDLQEAMESWAQTFPYMLRRKHDLLALLQKNRPEGGMPAGKEEKEG